MSVSHVPPRFSLQELIETICGPDDPHIVQADLAHVMSYYPQMSETGLAQATFLVTIPRFEKWLLEDASDLLLVEAHCSHESIGRISPMSVFCSIFITSRREAAKSKQTSAEPGSIFLSAFCGARMDTDSPFSGPNGLIRWLIIDLLISWPRRAPPPRFDLLERVPELWDDVQRQDPSVLCHIFHELVLQLPPSCKVFCIVDGISSFETELHSWEDTLIMLVNCLRDCVYDTQTGRHRAVLKVLLTSADKSISAVRCIDEHQQIDLKAGNYHAASQTYGAIVAASKGSQS
jgi:hypothetical protein